MKLQFVLNVGEIYGFTRKRMIDNSDPDIKPLDNSQILQGPAL